VLNGRRDVSPKARERILAVVEERNFVPNRNAKNLKQTASQGILLLVKGTSNMLFANVIEELQIMVEHSDHSLRVHYLDEDSNEVQEAIRICREHRPIGILFLGSNVQNFTDEFRRVTVPCVLVTDRGDELGFENLSSVSTDDEAASEQAVDYLFEHGHRGIGVIGGNLELSSPSRRRRNGCLRSFEKYGCTFDERCYETARYSFDSAYRAMKRLLEKELGITAVFAMSDVMAIGAIRAIYDEGLRVPEDISVIGFDGTRLADYYNPKIVTIRQGQEQIARRSVDLLLNMIDLNRTAEHELIPFTMKNTESVMQR
jgi:LacI family transcriptional regulator